MVVEVLQRGTGGDIRKVKVAGLHLALLVIVCPLQDRAAPFADQALCDALDPGFGTLAPCVEENNFADAAAQKNLFVDGQLCEGSEDVSLNVVRRKAAVVEWLEEVLDGLEEVGLGVEDGILDGGSVKKGCDLREKLELVRGGLALLAGLVVRHARFLHGDLEVRDLVIDFVFQVLIAS